MVAPLSLVPHGICVDWCTPEKYVSRKYDIKIIFYLNFIIIKNENSFQVVLEKKNTYYNIFSASLNR